MKLSSEFRLADKVTEKQELEEDLDETKARLNYTIFEINELKDAVVEEYREMLEEKQQEIEDLKEAQN